MCRLVPETGIRPNLDLDFVFLTFLKNIVFLYLGSNQVSKLLNNWLKLIGGRTTLMVARDWGGRLPGVEKHGLGREGQGDRVGERHQGGAVQEQFCAFSIREQPRQHF